MFPIFTKNEIRKYQPGGEMGDDWYYAQEEPLEPAVVSADTPLTEVSNRRQARRYGRADANITNNAGNRRIVYNGPSVIYPTEASYEQEVEQDMTPVMQDVYNRAYKRQRAKNIAYTTKVNKNLERQAAMKRGGEEGVKAMQESVSEAINDFGVDFSRVLSMIPGGQAFGLVAGGADLARVREAQQAGADVHWYDYLLPLAEYIGFGVGGLNEILPGAAAEALYGIFPKLGKAVSEDSELAQGLRYYMTKPGEFEKLPPRIQAGTKTIIKDALRDFYNEGPIDLSNVYSESTFVNRGLEALNGTATETAEGLRFNTTGIAREIRDMTNAPNAYSNGNVPARISPMDLTFTERSFSNPNISSYSARLLDNPKLLLEHPVEDIADLLFNQSGYVEDLPFLGHAPVNSFYFQLENGSDTFGKNRFNIMEKSLTKYRPDLTQEDREAFYDELMKIRGKHPTVTANRQRAVFEWFLNGTVRLPEDASNVEEALMLAEKNGVTAREYSSPGEIIDELSGTVRKSTPINPDDYPDILTNKQELQNGITIYDVPDTDEARNLLREIIDTHLGYNRNPWCLLSRGKDHTDEYFNSRDMFCAASFWYDVYNKEQKRVMFKDGKIAAFSTGHDSASHPDDFTWYDLDDLYYPPHIKIEENRIDPKYGKVKFIGTYNQYTGELVDSEMRVGSSSKPGRYIEFYPDGHPKTIRTNIRAANGNLYPVGEYITYMKNEQLDGNKLIPEEEDYIIGSYQTLKVNPQTGKSVNIGEHYHRYPNGNLAFMRHYDNEGRKVGVHKEWNTDGTLASVTEYNNKGIEVKDTQYYSNGTARQETIYDKDGNISHQKSYNSNGQLTDTSDYDNDNNITYNTDFNTNGGVDSINVCAGICYPVLSYKPHTYLSLNLYKGGVGFSLDISPNGVSFSCNDANGVHKSNFYLPIEQYSDDQRHYIEQMYNILSSFEKKPKDITEYLMHSRALTLDDLVDGLKEKGLITDVYPYGNNTAYEYRITDELADELRKIYGPIDESAMRQLIEIIANIKNISPEEAAYELNNRSEFVNTRQSKFDALNTAARNASNPNGVGENVLQANIQRSLYRTLRHTNEFLKGQGSPEIDSNNPPADFISPTDLMKKVHFVYTDNSHPNDTTLETPYGNIAPGATFDKNAPGGPFVSIYMPELTSKNSNQDVYRQDYVVYHEGNHLAIVSNDFMHNLMKTWDSANAALIEQAFPDNSTFLSDPQFAGTYPRMEELHATLAEVDKFLKEKHPELDYNTYNVLNDSELEKIIKVDDGWLAPDDDGLRDHIFDHIYTAQGYEMSGYMDAYIQVLKMRLLQKDLHDNPIARKAFVRNYAKALLKAAQTAPAIGIAATGAGLTLGSSDKEELDNQQ